MSVPTFLAKTRVGRFLFQIRTDRLEISTGIWPGARPHERLLRTISPRFSRRAVFLPSLVFVPLLFSGVSFALVWLVGQAASVISSLVPAIYPALFGGIFLVRAIRGIPPVEFYAFRDHWHREIFHIVREKPQAAECDAFVKELVLRIEAASGDLPAEQAAAVLAGAGPYASSNAIAPPSREDRWLSAILAGGLAAGLPVLPAIRTHEFGFFLVFLLSLAGLAFAVFSFQAKERFRWCAILGAIAALVPAFLR